MRIEMSSLRKALLRKFNQNELKSESDQRELGKREINRSFNSSVLGKGAKPLCNKKERNEVLSGAD